LKSGFQSLAWEPWQAKIHYSQLEKVDKIKKYFPELRPEQLMQLENLYGLYLDWNSRINVISRKDMDFFYERHVLHSLSPMKVFHFRPGTRILDAGTGGGFPGIPLAICYPECNFMLADSIGKKIAVVEEVANSTGLYNVKARKTRIEDITERFDFVVSRAVTALPRFVKWVEGLVDPQGFNDMPNGILYLKGGDIEEETAQVKMPFEIYPLNRYFDEAYFETKKLVHLYGRSSKFISDKANSL
jgi:16S rRNA (guanine527-N7)-methyltransferase